MQHVDVPIPTPKRDEVCLKLEAASLNPSDWKVQKGVLWPVFPGKLPHIPGNFVTPVTHNPVLNHKLVVCFVTFG